MSVEAEYNEICGQFTICPIVEVCCHTKGAVCTVKVGYWSEREKDRRSFNGR